MRQQVQWAVDAGDPCSLTLRSTDAQLLALFEEISGGTLDGHLSVLHKIAASGAGERNQCTLNGSPPPEATAGGDGQQGDGPDDPDGGGDDGGGGPPARTVGASCTDHADCDTAFCYKEAIGGQATGFLGGYCSKDYCSGDCPDDAVCVGIGIDPAGRPLSFCLNKCLGGQADCRSGYACWPGDPGPDYCFRRCDTTAWNCGDGFHCGTDSGHCEAD